MSFLVIDIETCPINTEDYLKLPEEEKKKSLNPIDSHIVAIGLRCNGEDHIFREDNEKAMLEQFWAKWKELWQPNNHIVGFNIVSFDLPFITTHSFIHGVKIIPFTLKSIVDVREKINAYRYGPTRGTLKEYAQLTGVQTLDIDGSDVAQLCVNKDYDKLIEYLKKDLEITEQLYLRAKETNILNISRW